MNDQDISLVKRSVNSILSNFDYQKKELASRWLKDLKQVVRKNESIISHVVDKLFEEFNKGNSDRRMGAMLITDYFFQRSHKFRLEIVEHMQDLILFTIETDPIHYPLPPPIEAAALLKKESLIIIKAWIEKFSAGYSKLNVASQYLTNSKHFDFREANEQLLIERRRAEEEQKRKLEKAKKIGKEVKEQFREVLSDIDRSLSEFRNSISLLYPDLFKHNDDDPNEPSTSNSIALTEDRKKLHGYKKNENITIVINSAKIDIKETQDNSALVDALVGSQVLLNKYQKQVKKWLKTVVQVSSENTNARLISALTNYKAQISHELQRFKKLNIKRVKRRHELNEDSDVEDESDFEDVVMEELELGIAPLDIFNSDSSPEETQVEAEKIDEEPKPGPSSELKPESIDDDKPSTSKKEIAKVAFGLDLKYWGQDIEPAMIPRNEFDGHPFWRASDPCDTVTTEPEDIYRSRQMTFVGERPVIKHQCRAPLPSGKLCPRMDLEKCPFHGQIVPRDEMGFPIHELGKVSTENLKMVEERIKKGLTEEEDEYLRDLEAATGVAFTLPGKGRRQRATTNTNKNRAYGTARKREKTQTDLSRDRLNKKLFNRSSVKRVMETLTSIQQERAKKNFSSQFNYSVNR